MSHGSFTLRQAAEHVHLDANELRHAAQRGEIEAIRRGDEWVFEHRALDEWAQRNLLATEDLAARHRAMMDEDRRAASWSAAGLFVEAAISLEIAAKTKPGIIRDMTDLADASGRVYDPEGLFRELIARENAASTAIGDEVALLHPRFHDPYLFESDFIAYGRSARPIFFGAQDGEGTRHFFLICSTESARHLHILARLAMLVRETPLKARLEETESAEAVIRAVADCERELRA